MLDEPSQYYFAWASDVGTCCGLSDPPWIFDRCLLAFRRRRDIRCRRRFIAKRFDQETALGRYLDPLADKALLVGVYATLGYSGHLPIWLVILVVFRDLIIIGGVILLHIFNENIRMNPLFISKANTTAQIVLVVVVLAELGVGVGLGPAVTTALIYLTAMTTIASGGVYVLGWGRNVEAVTDGDASGDSR